MDKFVQTTSGLKIAIEHLTTAKDRAIIIAPGVFASKSTPVFKKLSHDLAHAFDVVSMDFRGHGRSAGFYTFSAWEKEDLRAVLDYAKAYYGKVGVLGFSYGGAIAIIEQAECKNIDSLVCVSTPRASEKIEFKWWTLESLKLSFRGFKPHPLPRFGSPFLPKTRPEDVVSSLSHTPILFIHGTRDPTVSLAHSQILYEKASKPKKIKIFSNASHAEDIYRMYPKEFVREVVDWFNETLQK